MAIEKISIEIKSNAKQVKQELADIDARLKKLASYKTKITIDTAKLVAAKKEISSADEAIKKLQNRKVALQVSGKSADEAKAKLEELQGSIQTLSNNKAKLQVEVKQLENASTVVDKLNKEMTNLSKKKAYVQVEKEDAEETENALDRLKTKLTQVSSTRATVNLSSNISSIGSQLDNMGSKLLSMLNPLKSQLSQWIGIGAAVKAVNSAISLISSSVSGAISRYDTLNNFPKIMANFKISTEDATAAINKLNDGLDGLPTEIDTATTAVQRFVTKNNDINKSTDYFLALNNALIAGATDASTQSSALEQLLQAYSKGTLDMVEWRSLLTAMPGQLNQVAIAMGYTSDALGEGLRDGSISMDDFMDTIARLNTEGVDGFASFEEQALAAIDGVEVGLTRMKTAVKRGVTSVIESLDTLLKNAGLGGLVGTLSTIGSAFETGLKRVGEIITENEAVITNFINKVRSFDWASVWAGFKESVTEIKESARSFLDTMEPVIDFIKDRITALGDGNFAKGLGKLPALLLKVSVAAKAVGKALKVFGKLTDFKLPSIFGGSSSEGSTGLSFNFDAGKMLNQVKNLALVYGVIKTISAAAQALKDVNDKVPSDLSKLAPKLINMGVAITGMGALVAVAGKLSEDHLLEAVAGLVVIAGISANLIIAAEAMQQIDEKVPSNILNFVQKLANMAIAIAGMGVIVAAVGALMATGVGALIAGAGLVTIALFAGEMILVAEAISQLDSKVPSDMSGVKKKIENIAEAIGYFTTANLGSVMDLFKNIIGTLNVVVVTAGINKMTDLASALQSFKVGNINAKQITKKIENIEKAIEAFTTSKLGSVSTLFKNFVSNLNINVVTKAVRDMNKLPTALEELEMVDSEGASDKIKAIEAVFIAFTNAKLGDAITLFKNFVSELNLSEVKNAIDKMNELPETLENTKYVNAIAFEAKLETIEEAFSLFTNAKLGNAITLFTNFVSELNLSEVQSAIEKMNALPVALDGTRPVNVASFEAKLETIVEAFRLFTNAGLGNLFTLIKNIFSEANIAVVNKAIESISEIATKINSIKTVNNTKLAESIGEMETAFKTITSAKLGDLFTLVKNFFSDVNLNTVLDTLDSLNSIATKIGTLQTSEIDTEAMGGVIRNISTVINQLSSDVLSTEDVVTAETLQTLAETVDGVVALVDKINLIGAIEIEPILTTISGIKDALAKINELPTVISASVLEEITTAISNLATTLTEMQGLFTEVGTGYGNEMITGFNSADIPGNMIKVIETAITKLKEKKAKFTEIGKAYGDNLRKAFESAVKNMYKAIDSQITSLKSYNASFTTLGTNYGTYLVNSFNTAISKLSASVSSQVRSMQTSLNSLSVPTLTVSTGSSTQSMLLSTGGEVPQYLASGGISGMFKKKGTDTVPAMLTPGEFVQNKKAVSTFGLDFMNRVNNLDIKGAFNALTGRFSTYTMATPIMSSVVNNADNRVNNAKVTQNITSGSQNYSLRRANRYVSKL